MKRYKVITPQGVHSMAAGKGWPKGNYVLEGQVPRYLISAWLKDGVVVEESDAQLCAGFTAKGQPCKRHPVAGSEYCQTHQPDEDQAGE